jgi:hypothetical protein
MVRGSRELQRIHGQKFAALAVKAIDQASAS